MTKTVPNVRTIVDCVIKTLIYILLVEVQLPSTACLTNNFSNRNEQELGPLIGCYIFLYTQLTRQEAEEISILLWWIDWCPCQRGWRSLSLIEKECQSNMQSYGIQPPHINSNCVCGIISPWEEYIGFSRWISVQNGCKSYRSVISISVAVRLAWAQSPHQSQTQTSQDWYGCGSTQCTILFPSEVRKRKVNAFLVHHVLMWINPREMSTWWRSALLPLATSLTDHIGST